MKHSILYFISLLVLCLFSCGGGDDELDGVIVSSERIEIIDLPILAAEGGERQVEVNANCAWTINVPTTDNWLSITPTSGTNKQTITIKCVENNSNITRISKVSISGEQRYSEFKVIQNPSEKVIITISNFSRNGLTSSSVDYTFSLTPVSDDITSCGVCYSTTNNNPNLDDNVSLGTRNNNIVQGTVSSLTANTTYYFRAFVTNSSGTYYSLVQEIATENNVPGRDDNQPPS